MKMNPKQKKYMLTGWFKKQTSPIYRDANAKEIDLFVEENNQIHPLEIKKSANPNVREVRKFDVLEGVSVERGTGGIVCMCQEVVPIDGENCFSPCNLI